MTAQVATALPLRERTRRAVRAELLAVAMDLFASKGYDATTVDEIAAAAGISRRSFFRYFASKEDVVLGDLDSVGGTLVDALAARPADEDAWTALRRAFDVLLAYPARDPRDALAFRQLVDGNPDLRARHLEKQCRWHDRLIPLVAPRLAPARSGTDVDTLATAVVGAALACLEAANGAWKRNNGQAPLDRILDDAMRAVHPGAF
ncbi:MULTISPECIES: TetR/AcrR family transcriptional regulator [Pseudofrankia]|uniref:TetR/AcrR family transcriptional regulator n=1 Tax=Pseudofrankia TaxID=2994363 RepID=UPI000234CACC|nr:MULTISPECIES: TetR/AcrR family transcriptional regulator [Pseudofrankia]OHV29071.1 TetR family transcriptional regulator [Pseudofrankia sp. EUN1h]